MSTMTPERVASLAKRGGALADKGNVSESLFQDLTDWLTDNLEGGGVGAIALAARMTKAHGPVAERYLTRAIRVVAGSQTIELVPGVDEWVHLLAVPVFLHPRQRHDVAEVLLNLECRAELERSLEHALGLGFASLRFCDHPVSPIDLESLDVQQVRRVGLDLLHTGDSAFLTPPVLDVGSSPEGAHHVSLLWPAVWKVRVDQRDEQMPRISGALQRSEKLSQFKHRADELIEQELLRRWGIGARADIYMPALFHDVFTVFRLVELHLMLSQALSYYKQRCNSVSFGLYSNRLQYSLVDKGGEVLTADELRAPEEAWAVVAEAIRATCARHGVAATVRPGKAGDQA